MKFPMIAIFALSLAPYAAEASPSPAQGCREVVAAEFEDGASFYQAVSEKVLKPLYAEDGRAVLARFLEDAIVTKGYLSLTESVCDSIEAASR